MNMLDSSTSNPKVVSRDEWIAARKAHLANERELTHRLDELRAERRQLPWVEVDKTYVFEGPNGPETLADLFDGRSQLIVYHFMFGPDWQEGCPGCSFVSDHIDGVNLHLPHHDVTLLAVSRAPYAAFQDYKKRMGWQFKWVSSAGSDFNADYHVYPSEAEIAAGRYEYNYELHDGEPGEQPGISVFYKDPDGRIFHTYSSYARGGDMLIGTHHFLDMTPKGRNERSTMDWVRRHDRYEDRPAVAAHDCCS
ncbi:hypothetical protein K32_28920 [Kaistia sp. 32K]|uniref:DUF899 domain-containing protein n=1 Tax=Kaistia sp. 32K TaxID=2795690 RepID=UPI001916BE51|nr:thioredoxin family protein [Kaistia sp. 32K]BCP54275.1 hypothetical protein K32_28920 [Kaistia sp. 32K]